MHHLTSFALVPLLALCMQPLQQRLPDAPTAPSKPAPSKPTQPVTTQGAIQVQLESLAGEITTRTIDNLQTDDPRQIGAWILRFENPIPPPASGPDIADLHLAHGERLIGRVRRGEGETLDIDVAPLVHARATLDEIRSLVFKGRVPAGWNAPLEAPKEGDRLYRRKGDAGKDASLERIEGGVESFGEAGVVFHDARVGSLTTPWDEVVALFVESSADKPAKPAADAVPVVIDLVDATRLAGKLIRLDPRGLTLERRNGEKLLLPTTDLSLVVVDDGKLVFLSDLPPQSAEDARPFGDDLGMRWPHVIDASVTGSPLSAGGHTFARGIGVHSPSRITWALDGTFVSLRGRVAVDDSARRLPTHGSVRFRVLVDGVKRFETRTLGADDPPMAIVLEPKGLTGAKQLTLEVDPAEDSFVADRADWLQIVLVRQ
jgi:hypothetical protein